MSTSSLEGRRYVSTIFVIILFFGIDVVFVTVQTTESYGRPFLKSSRAPMYKNLLQQYSTITANYTIPTNISGAALR